jgi:DNA-binding transcriptional MocR family regulator
MDEKLHCFPSIATVAEATGLSKRTVLRHLHAARDEGWILTNAKAGSGRGWKRNEYVGTYPQGGDPVSVPKPQGGDTRSAPQAQRGDPVSMRWRSSVHGVVTEDHTNSSKNSSKNSSDSFKKETVEKKKKAYRDGVKKARGALERPSHNV